MAEAINSNSETTRKIADQQNISSSVERYRREWFELLQALDESGDELIREHAFNGELRVSKFRSIYWALLLRVLNVDYRNWSHQRDQQRKRYERLTQDFLRNPHDFERPDDDPLSQSSKSIWNQYFSDQELFGVIRQDVVRTFPGVDFFRKPIIQNAMSNVLFYYAREHPYMCYRQGMHEILAPILFVLYSDHQSILHFMEIAKKDVDPTLLNALNPAYFEADAYSIFARLMSSIEAYYRVTNLESTQGGAYLSTQLLMPSTELEVIGQLNFIRDKILAKEDLHLHNYLLKMDIPLHIFGIRWLRLLFGREFALLDLLLIWDSIFADSDCFNLPNYILVAMLIRIRDKLLLSDYTSCLTYLMRYPAKADVNIILQHALHMLMPKKYERPANAFIYFTAQQKNREIKAMAKSTQNNVKLEDFHHQRIRSVSLNGTTTSQIEQQITAMQAFNAADAAAQARLSQDHVEVDRNVIDGYSSNSPELLRLELKNAQTIISIARNKLQGYLSIVRNHAHHFKTKSEDLNQALDGIEELCSLLDIKYMFPLHTRRAPIDQAFEAYEIKSGFMSPNPETSKQIKREIQDPNEISPNQPLKIHDDGYKIYERPEDCNNATRLFGNLKEIELISIASVEKTAAPVVSLNTKEK